MYADDMVIYSSGKSKSKIEEDLEFIWVESLNILEEKELIVNLKIKVKLKLFFSAS